MMYTTLLRGKEDQVKHETSSSGKTQQEIVSTSNCIREEGQIFTGKVYLYLNIQDFSTKKIHQ